MDARGGRGPFVATAVQPEAPRPSQPTPSGPLPTGKITEAQAAQYPQTQKIVCGQCGRMVLTPKGAQDVVVICDGCKGEVEAIPF